MKKHEQHVWLVLDKFKEIKFYIKLEKCEFHQTKVKFFKYIIFKDGIHMNPCMVLEPLRIGLP
jgi:hypothetical protein